MPTTANLKEWGDLVGKKGNYPLSIYDYGVDLEEIELKIHSKLTESYYLVKVKKISFNGKVSVLHKVTIVNNKYLNPMYEFIDIIEWENEIINYDSFTRIIKDQLIVYENNKTVYVQTRKKVKFFKKLKKSKKSFMKIICLRRWILKQKALMEL